MPPDSLGGMPLQHSAPARIVHALLALLTLAGLVTSLYLGWTRDSVLPGGVGYTGVIVAGWEHMLNQLAYFTFLSGLMVLISSAWTAVRPGSRSALLQTVRISGLVCIIITGLVFNLLLRGPAALTGVMLFNDTVLHVVVPLLAPLVWAAVGPHGRLSLRIVLASMLIPVAWLVVTLARGPRMDWYPYEILDVPALGYAGVSVYIVSILLLYLALAFAFLGLDRLLLRLGRGEHRPA